MSSSRKRSQNKQAEPKAKKLKDNNDAVTQRLLYGLHNQGATCYLNSVLQVLSVTTEIHDRLEPRSETDQELLNIFEKLKGTTCETGNITKSLGIENVHQQRDAAECLELILNKISPQASEAFQGELLYTTKCSSSHIINEETNPFWTLPLSLKDTHDEAFSVESGFKTFFEPKLFNGDNMVYCNDCNEKTEAESGCEMVEFPQILTLLLKRFEFDYNTMKHVKTNCSVDVPRALQRRKTGYTLYGMVNHMGSLKGGHYTATILSKEDNTWYEFDDTWVNKAEKQPFAETGIYNSSDAYLLVYRASGSLRDEDEQRDSLNFEENESQERRHLAENAEHEQIVPSLTEDESQEDVFVPEQTHDTSNSSTQHPCGSTVEEMEEGRKTNENSRKPCKLRPLWISLIVGACVVVVVVVGGLVIALPIIYQ